jgi:Ras-related GTP-binding protein C/D
MAELPSHISAGSPEFSQDSYLQDLGAAIWVIDVQSEYLSSINELISTAMYFAHNHPRVHFEVFIHKTDGLSDEYRYDAFREVRQRVQDELSDADLGGYQVLFYQSSIFDHSIFESMSKVVQRLLPQLDALESLLNKLCSTCGMQKAYLFDTVSKMYVATDASPTFLKDYEVCSDYVDVIVDIKSLYGWHTPPSAGNRSSTKGPDNEEEGIGESVITFERSGDTYIYAREINEYVRQSSRQSVYH